MRMITASFEPEGYRFRLGTLHPRLTITRDGTVILSALAYDALGRPPWALLYHDPARRAIAVVGATACTPGAVACRVDGKAAGRARLAARAFLQAHRLSGSAGKIYDTRTLRHPSLGPVIVADLDRPVKACGPSRRAPAAWEVEPCA